MEEPSGSAFLRKRAELKAANSTKTQDEEDEALAPTAGQEDETEHAEGTSDSTEPADVETADSTADGSSAIPNPADNTADGTGGSTVDSAAESTAASTEDSTAGTGMQEGNSAVPEPAESEAEAGDRRVITAEWLELTMRDASLVSRAEPTRTTSGTTFYFTLVSSNKYCANANAGYKKNVGNYQTKACFESLGSKTRVDLLQELRLAHSIVYFLRYVLADESCGNYFDFGVVDGACDCVPKSQTDCKEADAENYHVYLVQKGGPEALIEVNDQGMEVQANGEPVPLQLKLNQTPEDRAWLKLSFDEPDVGAPPKRDGPEAEHCKQMVMQAEGPICEESLVLSDCWTLRQRMPRQARSENGDKEDKDEEKEDKEEKEEEEDKDEEEEDGDRDDGESREAFVDLLMKTKAISVGTTYEANGCLRKVTCMTT
eukprot:g12772.t1